MVWHSREPVKYAGRGWNRLKTVKVSFVHNSNGLYFILFYPEILSQTGVVTRYNTDLRILLFPVILMLKPALAVGK